MKCLNNRILNSEFSQPIDLVVGKDVQMNRQLSLLLRLAKIIFNVSTY